MVFKTTKSCSSKQKLVSVHLIFFQVQLDLLLIGEDFLERDTNLTGLYCIEICK